MAIKRVISLRMGLWVPHGGREVYIDLQGRPYAEPDEALARAQADRRATEVPPGFLAAWQARRAGRELRLEDVAASAGSAASGSAAAAAGAGSSTTGSGAAPLLAASVPALLQPPAVSFSRLQDWGVPPPVCAAYASSAGISQLYPWQVRALLHGTAAAYRGVNFVYTAPTSGGKTLVAELVALRTLLLRRRKVMIAAPYVSVALEKAAYLQVSNRSSTSSLSLAPASLADDTVRW